MGSYFTIMDLVVLIANKWNMNERQTFVSVKAKHLRSVLGRVQSEKQLLSSVLHI